MVLERAFIGGIEVEEGVLLGADDDGPGGRRFAGGETKRSHMLRPMAHTSSQFLAPTSRPWVLHTHAMSHARSVIPSTKRL